MDGDGVKIVETDGVRRRVWLLLGAVALVTLALIIVVRPWLLPPTDLAAVPPARPAAPPGAAAAIDRGRLVERALPPAAEPLPPVAAPDAPASDDAAAALQAAMDEAAAQAADDGDSAEPSGIELFPPPGTNPPRSGIIVPEDFELPPGYVRHYQSTDDGEQLKAILMFHPDFEMRDERGNPVELSADRIVPPELAPPGLAIEMLEVPASEVPMVEVPEGAPH